MSGRIFGTDGVRGVANRELTPELAFRLGRAGTAVIAREAELGLPIVVGRDTRLSGTMLEAAVAAGITSAGYDVLAVGVVPTPAVAAIARLTGAAAGVMISASHNPIEDNGIKFFGGDGFKLPDETEDAIERALDDPSLPRPTHADVGIVRPAAGLIDRYFVTLLEAGADLTGLTVVVDAAHGAAFAIAPRALRKLGARVIELNTDPDGARINVDCGATDLRPLQARVRQAAAEAARTITSASTTTTTTSRIVGVAFDGDADRALFVDETGEPCTGDHVLLALARELRAAHALSGDAVVGTVMSNLGLERALGADGITLLRAAVGDRYVLEAMRAGGFALGGEQSGHIIELSRSTTGDGVMTAISLFTAMARRGVSLRELVADLHLCPQVLVNVRTHRRELLETDAGVRAAIERARGALAATGGRLLVRASGTEPLIRIMIEGDDADRVRELADELAEIVRVASAAAAAAAAR